MFFKSSRKLLVSTVFAAGLAIASPVLAQNNPVVAKVGDREITKADLAQATQRLQQQFANIPKDQQQARVLDALIDFSVLAKQAEKAGIDKDEDIARTLAMFGGFTEGLQLFASFAMLMNFPRFNKMKGMGQIVSWSVRDESLHCEGIIRMFHEFVRERDCLTKAVKEDIIDCCQKVVRLEDAFIDLAFEEGPVPGMTAKEIKKYIRYIADWRLSQLGLPEIYMVEDHPLPWLAPLLNGVEHANFFETRATEYSKGATKGNWQDVWSSFDNRKKAKAGDEANDETVDDGPGLFGDDAGGEPVAAE